MKEMVHQPRLRRRGLRDISNRRAQSSSGKRKGSEVKLKVYSRSQSTSAVPSAKRHHSGRLPPTADAETPAETPASVSAMTETTSVTPNVQSPRVPRSAWKDGHKLTDDPAGKLLEQLFTAVQRKEREYRCKPDYMETVQSDLAYVMRRILVDWIIEVGAEYRCLPQTVQLTVNYIDRFLSTRVVKRSKLQLLGVGAMLSASKFEEIWPPSVDDFVFISDNTYSADEIKEMERRLLEELNFRLVAATPNEFFKAYMLVVKSELAGRSEIIRKLELDGLFLQEFCMQTDFYVRLLPSMVAAISLFLARRYEGLPGWTDELARHTNLSEQDLLEQARSLDRELRAQKELRPAHRDYKAPAGSKGYTALFTKYLDTATRKYHLPTSTLLTRKRLPSWSEVSGWTKVKRGGSLPPHRG